MKSIYLVALLLIPVTATASDKLITDHDVSELLKPKTEFLGFIEPNFQRLKIKFESVKRDPKHPERYLVEGSSDVKGNGCKFKGDIHFDRVEIAEAINFGVDDQYKNAGIQKEGQFFGKYEVRETPKMKTCGIFKGQVTLGWYIDKDGKIRYDDLSAHSDGYKNNQYRGSWTAYGSKRPKIANWGEYRIPSSTGLDIGAGEFWPDPKYLKNGWDDFKR